MAWFGRLKCDGAPFSVRPGGIAHLAAYGAVVLLTACQSLGGNAALDGDAGSTGNSQFAAIEDVPSPIPTPNKDVIAEKSATYPPDSTPTPREKPPVTTLSKRQIVGAAAPDVEALIGTPETVIAAAPSQTWFYASGPCRFSVQFFKDLDSGEYRALNYDVEGGSLERCLAQFERLNAFAPLGAQSDINESMEDGDTSANETSG